MWRLPTPDAIGIRAIELASSVGARLSGVAVYSELQALCLFFAQSPVKRHMEWVLQQIHRNPGLKVDLALVRVSGEFLWDCCGTDRAKGLAASLKLLGLCNAQIQAKNVQNRKKPNTKKRPKC
jgi:hypothetical protein